MVTRYVLIRFDAEIGKVVAAGSELAVEAAPRAGRWHAACSPRGMRHRLAAALADAHAAYLAALQTHDGGEAARWRLARASALLEVLEAVVAGVLRAGSQVRI